MPNKSHFNSGHKALNRMKRDGVSHRSFVEGNLPQKTYHGLLIEDAVDFLRKIPDSSVQLILLDPPYNLDIAKWDTYDNYLAWAKQWLDQIGRVLSDSGSCVIFGGFQFRDLKNGDLLEIMHYLRHHSELMIVNLVVWYYKNGMSAHRFFANRHEEAVWFAKTKDYHFDLDAVRIPFDEATKVAYRRDKRLNPESIEKGKNPTNVWEIGRLQGNSLERVGHPTQKPIEIIQRFVRALSYPDSVVLDFFAGSGSTGRVCIEEGRHSIQVDNDPSLLEYFEAHLAKMSPGLGIPEFEILKNCDVSDFFALVQNFPNSALKGTSVSGD